MKRISYKWLWTGRVCGVDYELVQDGQEIQLNRVKKARRSRGLPRLESGTVIARVRAEDGTALGSPASRVLDCDFLRSCGIEP